MLMKNGFNFQNRCNFEFLSSKQFRFWTSAYNEKHPKPFYIPPWFFIEFFKVQKGVFQLFLLPGVFLQNFDNQAHLAVSFLSAPHAAMRPHLLAPRSYLAVSFTLSCIGLMPSTPFFLSFSRSVHSTQHRCRVPPLPHHRGAASEAAPTPSAASHGTSLHHASVNLEIDAFFSAEVITFPQCRAVWFPLSREPLRPLFLPSQA